MIGYGRIFRTISCALGQSMNQALSGMELTFSQGHILGRSYLLRAMHNVSPDFTIPKEELTK